MKRFCSGCPNENSCFLSYQGKETECLVYKRNEIRAELEKAEKKIDWLATECEDLDRENKKGSRCMVITKKEWIQRAEKESR